MKRDINQRRTDELSLLDFDPAQKHTSPYCRRLHYSVPSFAIFVRHSLQKNMHNRIYIITSNKLLLFNVFSAFWSFVPCSYSTYLNNKQQPKTSRPTRSLLHYTWLTQTVHWLPVLIHFFIISLVNNKTNKFFWCDNLRTILRAKNKYKDVAYYCN